VPSWKPVVAARAQREGGFSLLEVLVAFAILAISLTLMMTIRTGSVQKAQEGRNTRVAAVLARQVLCEIEAGLHNAFDQEGREQFFEDYEGFRYRILIGESAISDAEQAAQELESDDSDASQRKEDRLRWLHSRRDAQLNKLENRTMGETRVEDQVEEPDTGDTETFEEVAVVVRYFAPFRPAGEAELILRSRISTLALKGQTPEEAGIEDTSSPTPIPGNEGGD
jgi:general secretion pathway protein I